LVIPPKVAPIQAVIIPVLSTPDILEACQKLAGSLSDFRVKIDTRDGESLGFKINKWELQGVPVRIEVGKREIESGKFKMVRRDTGQVIEGDMAKILETIQSDMLKKQTDFLVKNTQEINTYQDFKKQMAGERGFVGSFLCEDATCEAKIKEETKASVLCLPLNAKKENGKCIYCNQSAKYRWVFAAAY